MHLASVGQIFRLGSERSPCLVEVGQEPLFRRRDVSTNVTSAVVTKPLDVPGMDNGEVTSDSSSLV